MLGAAFLGLFVLVEEYWAKEPLMPMRLLRNPSAILCYIIYSCQVGAQIAVSNTLESIQRWCTLTWGGR